MLHTSKRFGRTNLISLDLISNGSCIFLTQPTVPAVDVWTNHARRGIATRKTVEPQLIKKASVAAPWEM